MLSFRKGKKGARAGATFKLGSVTVNAKSIMQSIKELEPLARALPPSRNDWRRYALYSVIVNLSTLQVNNQFVLSK